MCGGRPKTFAPTFQTSVRQLSLFRLRPSCANTHRANLSFLYCAAELLQIGSGSDGRWLLFVVAAGPYRPIHSVLLPLILLNSTTSPPPPPPPLPRAVTSNGGPPPPVYALRLLQTRGGDALQALNKPAHKGVARARGKRARAGLEKNVLVAGQEHDSVHPAVHARLPIVSKQSSGQHTALNKRPRKSIFRGASPSAAASSCPWRGRPPPAQ